MICNPKHFTLTHSNSFVSRQAHTKGRGRVARTNLLEGRVFVVRDVELLIRGPPNRMPTAPTRAMLGTLSCVLFFVHWLYIYDTAVGHRVALVMLSVNVGFCLPYGRIAPRARSLRITTVLCTQVLILS